ncbi:NAD(P)-binding domain-containing protein [Glycomyces endophyticus]|uniref:NAD(P)-binding domain-containing protein n=1 Tax=Glycomyces endophyticus TaxID=480996 RepID=A0ABP4SHJ1_9ACTN
MTRTLGIIGAGMIGSNLARLAVAAGLDVVIANSRGPETLADLVAELGPRARAATAEDAALAGDLVVATIPLNAYETLPAKALADKTVLDTLNYYPQRDGRIAVLDANERTTSELVQRHLAHSRVVKAFNNLAFFSIANLARPSGSPERSALPIAGDDAAANAEAAALLDLLGFDAVDTGSLADSWRSEPGTPVYVQPYSPGPAPEGLDREALFAWLAAVPADPVPTARVEALVAAAVRGQAGGTFPGA